MKKFKFQPQRNGRVLFLEVTANRPWSTPVDKSLPLEDLGIEDAEYDKLVALGAEETILNLAVQQATQIRGQIIAIGAGHSGNLNGEPGVTWPIEIKMTTGKTVSTTVSLPEGVEPAKYDTVTINHYEQKGLYLQLAGESAKRQHSLMYVVEPGYSTVKATQIREVTSDELDRDIKVADRDAAQARAAKLRANASIEA